MSSAAPGGFFKGCRALMAAAAKSAAATTKKVASATKTTAGPITPKPKPKPAEKARKPPAKPSGILKVTPVSPALQQFLGAPEASRTDAVKKVWEHIKAHNLQTPTDKKVIMCDDKLKTIFEGKEKVGFLEIGKLLSSHFVKTA